jgi:amino-acid N-acetyltransferase
LKIRKAKIIDLKTIHKLINDFARKEKMLPRSMNEMYENVRDFIVFEEKGKISGICALHVLWENLAEIRSLAVIKGYQKMGIGRKLVRHCINEAKSLGVQRVFVLTYQPSLFKKMGFSDIDKSELPQKIWGDCVRCPKFPECDEYALILNF